MRIQLLGAAQTVTGSCYVIEACGKRFLIDCGMHQGNAAIEDRNKDIARYHPDRIDFICITHAHIDHSGLLPALVSRGYKNPIYATRPTCELMSLMLVDSAHIQVLEAEQKRKKQRKHTKKEYFYPLSDEEAAVNTTKLFRTVSLYDEMELAPGIVITYFNAGHILGSTFIRVCITEQGTTRTLVFSGDIGRPGALMMTEPDALPDCDVVFSESTYGDRDHADEDQCDTLLAEVILSSYDKGQKVVIPAFAVERTQEILCVLLKLHRDGKLPPIPVYVDSPLAIQATDVFCEYRDLFDEETKALLSDSEDPFDLPYIQYTLSKEASQSINSTEGAAIIISASGMCDAGRIKHHLKHNLWKRGASIVFVGYQAIGTAGRHLVDGAKYISLFKEEIEVKAKIVSLSGFSGHAGKEQLLKWLTPALEDKRIVILTHGERDAQLALAEVCESRFDCECHIPDYMDTIVYESGVLDILSEAEVIKRPPVDWEKDVNRLCGTWSKFCKKANKLPQLSWEQQTEVKEYLSKAETYLLRIINEI